MSEVYKVIYTGKMQPDADHDRLVALFSEKFKLGVEKAKKLIHGGRAVTLKKDLDREKAVKYQEALEKLGLVIELDPKLAPEKPAFSSELALEGIDNGDDDATEVLEPSGLPDAKCPKCGSGKLQMGICQDCGIVAAKYIAAQIRNAENASQADGDQAAGGDPYTPPEADLAQSDEGELVGPRGVPIGSAFSWVAGGWRLFKESPLAWIVTMVVWGILNIVLGMIPLLGAIALSLVSPTLVAGIMIGCREQEEGGKFAVSHLFAGFSQNAGQTILIGLLYLLFTAVLVIGMMLMMFGSVSGMEAGGAEVMATTAMTTSMVVTMVLTFIFFIMLFMAYVFAPALAALDGLSAWEAMKMSFVGCLKNILPLFLYVILSLLLMMLGAIPFGLGLLIVFPMLIGAVYSAYRDIYYD